MYFPDSRCFKFNKKYSGTQLVRYRNSFDFSFHCCISASFFDRFGSVVFADFNSQSFAFGARSFAFGN